MAGNLPVLKDRGTVEGKHTLMAHYAFNMIQCSCLFRCLIAEYTPHRHILCPCSLRTYIRKTIFEKGNLLTLLGFILKN